MPSAQLEQGWRQYVTMFQVVCVFVGTWLHHRSFWTRDLIKYLGKF